VRGTLLLLALAACRIGFDARLAPDGASEDATSGDSSVEVCVPSGDEHVSAPGTCSDGKDNDCNGATDHDDPDCPTMRYRSVGTNGALLATGSVEITGGTAYFAQPLPEHVGVGDAIVVDAVPQPYVAFIRGRASETEMLVQAADGGPLPDAPAGTQVSVFRAYTSLVDWASLAENTAIPLAVRNFDTSRDLVSANAALTVALYADGPDRGNATVTGWTTSPDHHLRLFTPSLPHHVGTSQRHRGTMETGYRAEAASNTPALRIFASHVRVEGLAVLSFPNAGPTVSGLEVIAAAADLDVRVSHNVADGNGSDSSNGIIHLEATGATATGTFRVSNNIAHGAPTGSSECMWHRNTNGASATFLIYHNTVWDCARGIEARDTAGRAIAINNIAFATSIAFYEYNGPGEFGIGSSHNVSNDASAGAIGPSAIVNAVASQLFVSPGGTIDLHLRGDAPIAGTGLDLHDDELLPILDDIDGMPRPMGGIDPGADQR
jgi:hypothetical protein